MKRCSVEVSRRSAVLGAAALAAVVPLVSPLPAAAENDAVTRGLSKYIKRKKYEDIESYLPPLVAARGQLIRSGYLLAQDPGAARAMLREGAFSGLRDNIRAVGDYAQRQGQGDEGAALVTAFFKALEAYDYSLLQGSRTKEGLDVDGGKQKLDATLEAFDRLLAVVPRSMRSRAEDIVSELEAEVASELEAQQAERALQEQQRLQKLLS